MSSFFDLKRLVRSSRPNDSFFAPEAISAESPTDGSVPEFRVSVGELSEKSLRLWSELPRVSIKSQSEDGLSAHLVATTALMKFKDDVRVQFIPLGDRVSSFLIHSASRVGYSDLGTNRKRLSNWIDLLKEPLLGA